MGFDLKEFLAPNWQKLVLGVILLIILSLLIFWKMEYLAIPILKMGVNMVCDDSSCPLEDSTFYFAFAAALSYLLACASIYIRARISIRKMI